MIVSKQKPFEEILRALGDEKRVYLIGCSECATLCKTGGKEELETMKQSLEKVGKIVVRARVLPTGCRLIDAKKEFWERKDMVAEADIELGHAKMLAQKVVSLGGIPTSKIAEVKIRNTPQEMIEYDIDREKRAIELYKELKELCRGEDEALYRIIDDILIDELKDLDEFSNMLEDNG